MGNHWCSVCGNWCDERAASPGSYCRTCWNSYLKWRYHQTKNGLDGTLKHYRYVFDLPLRKPNETEVPDSDAEKMGRFKSCPVCKRPHTNVGSYCKPCRSAYTLWAKKRRAKGLAATMEAFRQAYDNGTVVPHIPHRPRTGRIIRDV